jgi:hypothetical protein
VVQARAPGPQDSASMCRSCGRPAIAVTSVPFLERERGNKEVAPVLGVSWRTKARRAAHRGQQHMCGAQSHVSREAGRHGRAGTTARRAACLGGTEARRLAGVKHDGREHEHAWTTYGEVKWCKGTGMQAHSSVVKPSRGS